MAIQYYMRAFNTTLSQYVDWVVNDTPDSIGAFSGFPANQLINITVNRVVQSKVSNFLKPNQSRGGTDGYFFHVNSYDWINATAPGTGIPLNFTGFAIERGVNAVATISTATNATPINVTTSTPHGLVTGQIVTIIGVTGNINANGTWPITVLGTNNFTLNGSTGSGAPNAGTGNVFTPKDMSTLIWDEVNQVWRFVLNTAGDGVTLGASQSVKVNNFIIDGYEAFGFPTAQSGIIRLPNNQYIVGRDFLNNADVQIIGVDTFVTGTLTSRIKIGNLSTDVQYNPGIIQLDGYLEHTTAGVDGASVAQSGFIRDQNNTTIVAFRAQNMLSDVAAISSNTLNNLIVGDATNAGVLYNTAPGNVHQFQVNTVPQLEVGTSFVRFPTGVTLPTIFQTQAGINLNGQTLTLQAQNAAATGTGTGGNLNITSGAGNASPTANGVINLQTAGNTRITLNDTTEIYNIPNVQFASGVVAPNITQASTATALGQNTTIQAQNSTNLTGQGGQLILTSGMGSNTQNDGYLVLQSGGITQMIVTAFNYPAKTFLPTNGKVTVLGNLEVQGTLTTVDSTTVDIVGAVIHGNWSDPVSSPSVGIPTTVVGYSSHRGNLNGIPRDGASLIWTEGPTANNSTYGVTANTATTDGTLYASDGYWRAISTPGDGFGVDGYTAANSLASVGVLANNFVPSADPNPIAGTIPGSGGLRAPNDTIAVAARNLAPYTTLVVAGNAPLALPQATLNVVSTTPNGGGSTNFTTTGGSLLVNTSAGPQFAAYTGTTGTSFTGVTWPFLVGNPTISTGGIVGQTTPFTTVLSATNGTTVFVNLPQTTINVVSTAGFPQTGTLRVVTWGPNTQGVPANGSGVQNVTYTGITATTFTGCTGGTGTLWTGNPVELAPIVGVADLPLLGTDFGNRVLHGLSDGYAGITTNNTGHIFNTTTVASTPTSGLYDFWVNGTSQVQLASTVVGTDGYTQTVAVSPTISTPKIFQLVQPYTGANAGFNLLLQAQAGQQQTGVVTNNNGGNLTLASGAAGTGGSGAAGVAGVVTIDVGAVNNSTFNNIDPDADGYAEWLAIGPTILNPRLYQATLPGIGTAVGTNFKINAQAGQAVSGGTNNNGGNLVLASGTPGTGGTAGTPGQMEFFYGSTLELTLTDGSLQWSNLVTNPPTISQAGGVTNGQTMTLQAQNATNNGGILTLTSGIGGTTNTAGNVQIQTGAATRVLVTPTTTQFLDTATALTITPVSAGVTLITFASTDTGATINQTTTGGATGAPMLVQAQNAVTTGGSLNLASGSGATNGVINFQPGGTTQVLITATGQTIQWVSTVATPTLNQATTAGATGQVLTVQAQNAVTTGGNLALTSGTGTTAGNVVLQTGGTPRVTVTPTNTQFADTATALTITPVSAGTTQITFASTDTAAQVNQAATASATGAPMTVQAQNALTTGGALNLTSGTGATTNGNVNLQVGGTTTASVVPGKFAFNKGWRRNVTNVTGAYGVLVTDDFLAITVLGASYTVSLPASPTLGDTYTLKDTTGNAGTFPVNVSGNGNTIDGVANFSLNQAYAAVNFTFAGGQWSVN